MVFKVTSNLTQIAVAGLMALAVAFPSPQDAYKAITGLYTSDHQIEVVAKPEAVLIQPRSGAPARFELAPSPVENCMIGQPEMDRLDLVQCAGIIRTSIQTGEPDLVPEFALLDHRDRPLPVNQDTEKQDALIQICRLLWVTGEGYLDEVEASVCSAVTSGIEYQ